MYYITLTHQFQLSMERTDPSSEMVVEGNSIEGWYLDKDYNEKWDFEKNKVERDITLYAKWERPFKKVTYNSSCDLANWQEEYIPGSLISEPKELKRENYVLNGWYKDPECSEKWNFNSDKMTDSDLVLYAGWTYKEDYNPFDNNVQDAPVMSFGGHQYQLIMTGRTWEEAKAYCESVGGYLVTITSEQEQNAVYNYIKNLEGEDDIWIGLTDSHREGDWSHWVTGEKVTYQNWGTNEPDNTHGTIGQNYGVICRVRHSGSTFNIEPGQWDDVDYSDGTTSGKFICEWGEYDLEDDTISYDTDKTKNETSIVGSSGDTQDIEISPIYEGTVVTSIADNAFVNDTSVKTISIPNTVTHIGDYAFFGCTDLEEIIIPDSVTSIGSHAFDGCTSLKKVTLSRGMKTIPDYMFSECTSLNSVKNIEQYTSIGAYAFYDCKSLQRIDYSPKLTKIDTYAFANCTSFVSGEFPDSVVAIENNAFRNCRSLIKITIPSGLTSIKTYTFDNCTALKTIEVPKKVTSIDTNAFYNVNGTFRGYKGSYIETWCNANNKKFESINNKYRVIFNVCAPKNDVVFETKDANEANNITYVEKGKRIEEPEVYREGYKLDGWYTDSDYEKVWDFNRNFMPEEDITLYAKWVEKDSAFEYEVVNSKAILTKYKGTETFVKIPEVLGGYPVRVIAEKAFAGNGSISSVVLPSALDQIEAEAFAGCTNLVNISSSSKNSKFIMEAGVLYSADRKELIYALEGRIFTSYVIPEGTETIYSGAFANQNYLTKVEIPDTVISIEDNAFPCNAFITLYGKIGECAAKEYADKYGLSYNEYQVTFYDGKELVYICLRKAGELLEDYYEPTTDFASFGGWYKDEECSDRWNFDEDTMPAGNLNLYLKWDSDFSIQNTEDGIVITGYNGTKENIIVPEEIEDHRVIKIAEKAFVSTSQQRITSITIPSGVTVIENDAITGNNALIIVGDQGTEAERYAKDAGLTFENRAYEIKFDVAGGAEIESITAVPGEIIELPVPIRNNYHFMGWYTSDSYNTKWDDNTPMPANDVTLYAYWKIINSNISDQFSYEKLEDGTICITKYTGKKMTLSIPAKINGLTVSEIGDYVFSENRTVQSVEIPDTVTSLGNYTFADSAIRSISGGHNISSIGEGCFVRARSLANIKFLTGIKEIPTYAFSQCSALTEVEIPEGVEKIGDFAFYDDTYLQNLIIPESVVAIGTEAFTECPKLKAVNVPGTLEKLDENIFDQTTKINYIAVKMLKILELKQVTKSSVHLKWNEVQGADGYYLYRKQENEEKYSLVKAVTETATENYNLKSDTTYYYKIQAYTVENGVKQKGAESEEAAIKVSGMTTPVISEVKQMSEDTASMSWEKVSGAEGYEVYRAYDYAGTYQYIKAVEDTKTINTGLIGGKAYYYKIRAYHMNNEKKEYSDWSDIVKFVMPLQYMEPVKNLNARETAAGTVLLAWDAIDGADGYNIYRQTGSGKYSIIKSVESTSTYNYNLVTGQTYKYKVSAYYYDKSQKCSGECGEEISVTIHSIATPGIKNISQSAAGTALISWSSISGVKGYELWRSRTVDGTYYLMKSVDGTATSNYNLSNGVTYFYKVRAYKEKSDGSREYGMYSSPESITIGEISKTRIKSVLQADSSSAKIVWASVTNAEGYEVTRSIGSNKNYEIVRDTAGTAIQDRGLVDGQVYYYKIRAYKKTEEGEFVYGDYSDELSIKIIASPTILVVEQSGKSSLEIRWNKVDSAEGYELWGNNSTEKNYEMLQDCTKTKVENHNLTEGATYSYKVRAYYYANGEKVYSSYSNVMETKVLGIPEITSIAQNGDNAVNISWNESIGADGYELWRAAEEDGLYEKIKNVSGTTTGNFNLTGRTKYYYKIRAYATVGGKKIYSSYGNIKGITVLEKPVIGEIEQLSTSSCKLSWQSVENATAYKIYRATNETGKYSLVTTVTGTEMLDTDLAAERNYYYKLKAVMEENGELHESAYSVVYSIYIVSMEAPTISDPQQVNDDGIEISFSEVNGAEGYEVWRSVQNDANFSLFSEQTETSFEDTGLETLRNYYYKVRAYKTVNNTKVYSAFSKVTKTGLIQMGSSEGIEWKITGSKVVFSGKGTIGTSFRQNNEITEVEIESGITEISSEAFYRCANLQSVKMSNDVQKIGTGAFRECPKLESINLSEKLTVINSSVFNGDVKLEEVALPDEITSIEDSAFYNCRNLKSIIIPNTTKSIANYAFAECTALKKVVIPKTVTSISECSFSNIGAVTAGPIGGDYDYQYGWTKTVPSYAFSRMTNLKKLTVGGGVRTLNSNACYYDTGLQEVVLEDSVEDIEDSAFRHTINLRSIKLGSKVEYIGNYAFYEASKLNNVVIPDTTTTIGASAFQNCSELSDISFGTGLKQIGNYAFYDDGNLNNIEIPEGTTTIGNYAFANCTSLTKLVVPGSVTSISEYSFSNIGATTAGPVGGDYDYQYGWKRTIPRYAFSRMTNLKNITLGKVRTIGDYACYYCTNLQSAAIEDGVESIGYAAFSYATNLRKVEMGSNVESIGDCAFQQDSKLDNVIIPDATTTIGSYAFENCKELSNVRFGTGLNWIGSYAFYNDSKLNNIEIPEGTTGIGNYAFANCRFLTKLIVPGSVTSISEYSFSNIGAVTAGPVGRGYDYQYGWKRTIPRYAFSRIATLREIVIGNGVRKLSSYACYYCTGLKNAILEDCVESIEDGAFQNCSELTNVKFGTGLEWIGSYAFYDDNKLNNVEIPEGTTGIGNYAFANCTSLTKVVVPGTVTSISEYSFSNIGATTAGPIGGEYDYQYGWKKTMPGYAFSRMNNLKKVRVGGGIKTINNHICYSCTKLENVILEDSVENVGYAAFQNCSKLASVDFGTGMKWIDRYAFSGDSELNNVEIPEGTTGIGNFAFADCTSLTKLTVPGTVTNISEYSFSDIGVTTAGPAGGEYDYQYGWTTNIPDYAFSRITKLTDIVITDTVESIGNYIFRDGTKEIHFEGPAATIGSSAFYGSTVTAYYLIYEQSWTENNMKNYGGSVTWKSYGELGNIQELSIKQMPLKISYEIGEELNLDGLMLNADYDSGRTMVIPASKVTAGEYDFSTAGEKTITVTYEGLSVTFNVDVIQVAAIIADAEDYPESDHNYANNMDKTWNYTYPDAVRLTLDFSESTRLENGCDYIYIYDANGNEIGKYTGSALTNASIEIPGNTFSIRLTSDGSVTYYGFSFNSIIAHVKISE